MREDLPFRACSCIACGDDTVATGIQEYLRLKFAPTFTFKVTVKMCSGTTNELEPIQMSPELTKYMNDEYILYNVHLEWAATKDANRNILQNVATNFVSYLSSAIINADFHAIVVKRRSPSGDEVGKFCWVLEELILESAALTALQQRFLGSAAEYSLCTWKKPMYPISCTSHELESMYLEGNKNQTGICATQLTAN